MVFCGASFLTLLHAGVLPYTYRSARSSVGMPFLTLCVMDLRYAAYSGEDAERPERHTHAEHGHDDLLRVSRYCTLVFCRTPIVPHAPAWECPS